MPHQPLPTNHPDAIAAQAELHHAYLLGLQLTVSMRKGPDLMEEWMFHLFRRQHTEKFLASFDKLGLSGLSHAVACARYHVLSNSIGGVPVEYMEEGPKKAWVRFRYPRWMYAGPAICGVPIGVSRGFLRGWYAHNGVSLGNPRLGFVCVSEDMSGEYGMCGYFHEYEHDLRPHERLQFARDELPPPFDVEAQPLTPAGEWSADRLAKANRNYAVDFVRNGLRALAVVAGEADARELGCHSARLIGLQYYSAAASRVGAIDGDVHDAARFLANMFAGMGDEADVVPQGEVSGVSVRHRGLRIVRGLDEELRELIIVCWSQLWVGAVRSHRQLLDLEVKTLSEDELMWTLSTRGR